MKSIARQIRLATTEPIQLLDITAEVDALLRSVALRDGIVTLMSPHTTSRVNLNERESELQQDMQDFLARLAPRDGDYRHNREPVDGRDNAHSHLLGLFMNATETVPFADGRLLLGGWQSIFFVELDGPRPERVVNAHFLGQ
jgi:secondary thiamine-phosphate synthase enzyme